MRDREKFEFSWKVPVIVTSSSSGVITSGYTLEIVGKEKSTIVRDSSNDNATPSACTTNIV